MQTVAVHLLQRYTSRFLSDYNLHLALQSNRAVRLTAAAARRPPSWQSNLLPADIFIDERSLLGRRTHLAISSYLSRYHDRRALSAGRGAPPPAPLPRPPPSSLALSSFRLCC